MPQTILVVEDSLDTRLLLNHVLATEGYAVLLAANGRDGLSRASADRPDLIITDLNMPVLDGISMIEQLRAAPGPVRVPIIALTAHGRTLDGAALRAGADRTAAKPFEPDELIAQVRSLLAAA